MIRKIGEASVKEVVHISWCRRGAYFKKRGSGCCGEVEYGVGVVSCNGGVSSRVWHGGGVSSVRSGSVTINTSIARVVVGGQSVVGEAFEE